MKTIVTTKVKSLIHGEVSMGTYGLVELEVRALEQSNTDLLEALIALLNEDRIKVAIKESGANSLFNEVVNKALITINKEKDNGVLFDVGSDLLLSRSEMLETARTKINSHFLTDYKTHDEIMADNRTGFAMIGFMKCWEWLKK